jgi:hypothetical protein
MSSHFSQAIALPPTPVTAAAPAPHSEIDPDQGLSFHDANRCHPVKTWFSDLRLWLFELYKGNVGLLLIGSSQLFMTFMNIAVQLLNGLDKPVPTLEVCVPDPVFGSLITQLALEKLVFVRMVSVPLLSKSACVISSPVRALGCSSLHIAVPCHTCRSRSQWM